MGVKVPLPTVRRGRKKFNTIEHNINQFKTTKTKERQFRPQGSNLDFRIQNPTSYQLEESEKI